MPGGGADDISAAINSQMTTVDPLGNQTVTQFVVTGNNIVQPSSIAYYNGTSTLLKTVNYSYTPNPSGCGSPSFVGTGFPTQISTTPNDVTPNQVSQVTMTYDTFSWSSPVGTCTIYTPKRDE
jgi:hypothetical protein